MAWGGSLNKKGSDYIRKIREADRVVVFLNSLKRDLKYEEQFNITKVIEIIVENISKISERKN
ncbi:hypothetical protein LCGC14_1079040 [marine sediment metagenome]|uniref:Uncharacterized protein n=1 Tax=marine sediment metagenome TaxID=412755 RepID=A0A0F9MKM2_9ZZZZ|nr:hypothetical protein [archaeon]